MYLRDLEPDSCVTFSFPTAIPFRHDFGSLQSRIAPHRQMEGTRPYLAGDPTAAIDWKAYARTEQLLIKQKKHSARATVAIVISTFPSMHWTPPSITNADKKFALALRLALYLAYAHCKNLDDTHLYLVNADETLTQTPTCASQVMAIFQTLRREKFSLSACRQVFNQKHETTGNKPDIKYWLSDALADDEPTKLKQQAHICGFLHILSVHELACNWLNSDCDYFAKQKEASGKELQTVVNAQTRDWLQQLESSIKSKGTRYMLLTAESKVHLFLHFLKHFLT